MSYNYSLNTVYIVNHLATNSWLQSSKIRQHNTAIAYVLSEKVFKGLLGSCEGSLGHRVHSDEAIPLRKNTAASPYIAYSAVNALLL